MVKITNIIDSRMNNIEVLTLMTGLINVKHFTKFYLQGDSYQVRVDHHFYPSTYYGDSYEHLIYINNILVFQKFLNNYKIESNITDVKDLLRNRTCDEDEDEDEDITKNPPYAYRMWSVIHGIPVVINGDYEDGELITTVYYDQFKLSVDGEAQKDEFGTVLAEIICPCEYEELKDHARCIEKTLWVVYYFDRITKEFRHCEDDYEDDEENDEENDGDDERHEFNNETQTISIDEIQYFLVDNDLYNFVTNEYVRKYKKYVTTAIIPAVIPAVIPDIIQDIIPVLSTIDVDTDDDTDVETDDDTDDDTIDDTNDDTNDDDDYEYIETVETFINGTCFLRSITSGEIYDRDTHEFIGNYIEQTNTIAYRQ